MDDAGIHDEHLLGRYRQAAAPGGALVEVLKVGEMEAESGPDRGREALSRARNRVVLGNHREICGRAPRNAAWSRCQPVGALDDVHDDDHQVCGYRAAVGVQGDLVWHMVRVLGNQDAVRLDAGADPVGMVPACRWREGGACAPSLRPAPRPGRRTSGSDGALNRHCGQQRQGLLNTRRW